MKKYFSVHIYFFIDQIIYELFEMTHLIFIVNISSYLNIFKKSEDNLILHGNSKTNTYYIL